MPRSIRVVVPAALVAAVLSVALAGCASADQGVTLADTKGPAQLLRNSIAQTVPADVIQSQGETNDVSEGCGDGGIKRSWRSSVLLFIQPSAADQTEALLGTIGDALDDDGWTGKESSPSSNIHELRLTSSKTSSVIRLTATDASDDEGNGATMQIAVNGPCVVTDGPDSDEVKHLEDRD